ncbi:MAG: transcriptional repressor [Acidimicrobiales bacterium]|nr:transcriptional repressor [Acidimicrobiales bacterium]
MTTLDAEEMLRHHGQRVTAARVIVWNVLIDADEHLTAESVAERVAAVDPSINLASVYRSLSLFEELGEARHSHLGADRIGYWEIGHPDEHFHLVCRNCGRVDHHRGTLVQQITDHLGGKEHGFLPEQVELTVTGLCRDCHGHSATG